MIFLNRFLKNNSGKQKEIINHYKIIDILQNFSPKKLVINCAPNC